MEFLTIQKFDASCASWRCGRRTNFSKKLANIILLVVPIIILAAWFVNYTNADLFQAAGNRLTYESETVISNK